MAIVKPIRLGIIGTGYIVRAHLHGLRELAQKGLLDGITVQALCNRSRWKAESFVQRGQGPAQPESVGPRGDPMQALPIWVSDFQPSPQPAVYEDYREMLARERLDAVLVLTPVEPNRPVTTVLTLSARTPPLIERISGRVHSALLIF